MGGRQHDAISAAQLRSIGFTDSAIQRRLKAGRLHPKYQGVYAVGRSDLTPNGHRMAAVLACGEGAVLSHASAAALFGIRPSSSTKIDVTVPRSAPPRREGIRGHRAALTAADVTEVDGIPVTSLARTLLDLGMMVREPALEHACNQAVIERLFDMRAIEELLRRSRGHRGAARLRRVLTRGDLSGENVTKSGLEARYRHLCVKAGLPKPEINRYLLLGEEYHQVDFLWRAQRVVIETDSDRYHQTGWQRARDAHRDELLMKHRFLHDRVSEDVIVHRPSEAVKVASVLLDQAAGK